MTFCEISAFSPKMIKIICDLKSVPASLRAYSSRKVFDRIRVGTNIKLFDCNDCNALNLANQSESL